MFLKSFAETLSLTACLTSSHAHGRREHPPKPTDHQNVSCQYSYNRSEVEMLLGCTIRSFVWAGKPKQGCLGWRLTTWLRADKHIVSYPYRRINSMIRKCTCSFASTSVKMDRWKRALSPVQRYGAFKCRHKSNGMAAPIDNCITYGASNRILQLQYGERQPKKYSAALWILTDNS